jgi:hypothetical protein
MEIRVVLGHASTNPKRCCSDGDSLYVTGSAENTLVRLLGIDAFDFSPFIRKSVETVLIEIQEPCLMDLVSPDEREQLRGCIIEKIGPEVADLFVRQTERLLKERYNLSPTDMERLSGDVVFPEPELL